MIEHTSLSFQRKNRNVRSPSKEIQLLPKDFQSLFLYKFIVWYSGNEEFFFEHREHTKKGNISGFQNKNSVLLSQEF